MAVYQQAMLLAAGKGSRLAPLTAATPKPLIDVGGEAILLRNLRRLSAAGVTRLVINLHHLGEQIRAVGESYIAARPGGMTILYSEEPTLLAPAGGVRQAMARGFLTEPFLLMNADVLCDYDITELSPPPAGGCRLLLVDNPPAHPAGDFRLQDDTLCRKDSAAPAATATPATPTYTYAGIGAYHPALFAPLSPGKPHEMLPVINGAIERGLARGVHYRGLWHDIGAPDSLAAARRAVINNES